MTMPDTRAASGLESAAPGRTRPPALIVFSHLRWGVVVRRPQHLLTRLAGAFRVFFVEEPVHGAGAPELVCSRPLPGVEVLTPRTPLEARGFEDAQLPVLDALLSDFVAERGIDEPFVWLTTPMALPFAADLEPRAVIYDCAEDFAGRPGASAQLVQREAALMELADLVLTTSPSMHAARKASHPNLHCLPNAVDAGHFARLQPQRLECAAARALLEGLAHPMLGYFGTIDERLDLALLAAVADQRPEWQLVMVGPVADAVADALPQRSNIRWLGPQSHDMLPHLQSHWDACLLPLARGEATRFASPAQTLEYLAGGKPVIATAIADVAALYGPVVRLADDAAAFVDAVDAALAERPAARELRRAQGAAFVEACSWDGTAAHIVALMGEFMRPAASRKRTPETAHATRPAGADLPRAPLQALVAVAAAQPARGVAPVG